MGKKQIQKSLNIFKSRVQKELNPEKIILFGSYATKKDTEYSDVDILVVAKKLADIPQDKRIDVLYDLTLDLFPDFHVYGLTPQEYYSASNLTIISEIKKRGVVLN